MHLLAHRRARRGFESAKLELQEPIHRFEFGLEILEPLVVLPLELIDQLVELSLMGVDLLFKQSSPVLQVPANITHLLAPRLLVLFQRPSGLAGSRKTRRTLPATAPGMSLLYAVR
jgi:hypothetical protein